MLRLAKTLSATLALSASVAISGAALAQESAQDMMKRALGTTENVGPVITEAFERAATPLTPEQRELALKCWKDSVCETGHGTLTVAYADGFGENVWRRVTAMEFIEQALTYPDVKKIIYTSARGDASKAIADMRSYIAQKVDVIVMFADAGEALLPTVKEATEAGILVTVHNGTSVGGEAGKDFVASVGRRHLQARHRLREGDRRQHRRRQALSNSAARPAIRSARPGRAAPTRKSPIMPASPSSARPTPTGLRKAASKPYRDCSPSMTTSVPTHTNMPTVSAAPFAPMNRPARRRRWSSRCAPTSRACSAIGKRPTIRTSRSSTRLARTIQSRIALTAAMMKKAGKDVEPNINVPFSMKPVVKGMCNPDLPLETSVSTLIDKDMLKAMFAK